MNEVWMVIPGWPEYEASSLGRIRLAVERPNGRHKHGYSRWRKGTILSQRLRSRRKARTLYAFVKLRRGPYSQVERPVHRLVCLAFHGEPPSQKHHAAHQNCNSIDNSSLNLRWATPAENVADTVNAGRISRGETHTPSKLTAESVSGIKRERELGKSYSAISDIYGVHKSTIGKIIRRETWA